MCFKKHIFASLLFFQKTMKSVFLRHIALFVCFVLAGVASAVAGSSKNAGSADTVLYSRTGTASYYAARFQGRYTSSGEVLDNEKYTCASYLPYDTWVRVTHLRNGKSVLVRVTDRFRPGGKHLVDLTLRAAKDIDMLHHGVAKIRMEVLNPDFVRSLLPKDSISIALKEPRTPLLLPVQKPDCTVSKIIR